MADINRTVFSLDQAVGLMQALVALVIYLAGVVLVGRATALPLHAPGYGNGSSISALRSCS